MELTEFTRPVNSSRVSSLIKKQFGDDYKIQTFRLSEAIAILTKTDKIIDEFVDIHTSHKNASYLKIKLINEAVEKRAVELIQESQEIKMNKQLANALKIAVKGGRLSENQIRSLRLDEDMQAVLRSPKAARLLMKKIVESKTSKRRLYEGEIDQAQTTIAAQDIADQIQTMIGKFADVKYKDLPALHDSIRDAQGVEAAEEFNDSVSSSLDELTSALENAKKQVNNAIAVLTGQETVGGDLDLDDFEDEGDEDEDLDFDMDFEDHDEDEDEFGDEDEDLETDLGRERR